MSPIAEMVERMFDAGAPMLAIIAAITAMETVTRDVTPSSRVTERDGNKKRQQARRNRVKLQKLAEAAQANDGANRHGDVTRDSVTTALSVPLTSFLPSSSGEPLKKSKREVVARGTRLTAGAPLIQEFVDAAIEAGAHRDAIPKIWTEFVDYWSDIPGQRGCKLSWLGTWRNNVKRVSSNGHWNGQKNGRRTVHDAAKDLHEDLLRRVAQFDEPAPSGLCSGEGTNALRLLPPRGRQ